MLFITRIEPVPGGGGSNVYSYDVLAGLAAQGFEVAVLLLEPCLLRGRLPWVFEQEPGLAFRRLCPGYVKIGRRLWNPKGILWSIRNKFSHWFKFLEVPPLTAAAWGGELNPEETAWVKAAQSKKKWEVVICNYCWLSGSLNLFGAGVRKAILTHDVWHKHVARQSKNLHFQRLDRELEIKFLNPADIVIAITQKDAADFREMSPGKEIICAPMSCSPCFSDQPPAAGQLLFVGSDYQPNVAAVVWFMDEVGPLLEKKAPGQFHLNLVGSVGAAMPACKKNISLAIKGQVKNLAGEYAAAAIVIVPILSGTGLKIKLVEAIAHGKAIVTTTAGALGLEDLAGKAFQLADAPEEFADQLIAISSDEKRRQTFEAGAKEAALDKFSSAACHAPLVRSLRSAN